MMPAVVPPDDAGVMLVEFRRTFVYYIFTTVEVSIHPTQPLDYCDARMSEQG